MTALHPAPDASASTAITADALLADASAALARGEADEARVFCRAAYGAVGTSPDAARLLGAIARLEARAFTVAGNADAALDVLEMALAVADGHGDAAGAAHALNHVAIVHFRRGELDDATRLYEAARARARTAGERGLVAATTQNLGTIANVRGDVPRALSHYRRAMADYRTLGQLDDVASVLNNVGMAYVDLERWDEADAAYAEAIAISERGDSLDTLARLHGNVAELWVGRGDLARAQAACDAAMRICERMSTTDALGEAYKLSGLVARESGALESADVHFAAAERMARERGDLLLLAETAREQAELYRRQSRNRDTLQALNRAHRLFEQLRAQRDLADVDQRMTRLEGDFIAVARRWGESIEATDRYTQGHCQRVADLACLIAERAGLDAQALFWFRIGALLHDVGKLTIPADVLNKPGKLSDEEFALMRSHTTEGVRMLAEVEFPWDVRPIVESHHERWDGRGYPHQLAGEQIPLTARILCVADVYDALTSVRSYKRALSHDEAMALLRKDSGTAFDPQVFAWFEEVAPLWAARLAAAPADANAEHQAVRDMATERAALGLDPLTGLPGRQAFYVECARVLSARARDGRPTALVTVRMDDLDALIGERGRPAADAALSAVSDALSRNTRGGDFVGRYADDEFVVVLPDVGLADAHAAALRLHEAAEAMRALGPGPGLVSVRVSVGIAAAPQHGDTADALLAAADSARRRATGHRRAGGRTRANVTASAA